MPTKVIMPQLGESVVEGTVSRWLKQVGDTVQEYEPLLEISTDKVDSEIPAPAGGTLLEIYVKEGETVERGALLALIGAADVKTAPQPEPTGVATRQTASPLQSTSTPHVHSNGGYTGHVTPVVARMVAEHDIDLTQLTGTGRDGRVTKKDVEAYLEAKPTPSSHNAETELAPWERPGTGDLFKAERGLRTTIASTRVAGACLSRRSHPTGDSRGTRAIVGHA